MTFEELQKANENIKSIDIRGKQYAEVNQRVKVFRMLFPNGAIITELLSDENGKCIFKATVSDENGMVLATGTAYERENTSNINKTSYIENCETSCIGRALAMLGIGIDTSIASYEEVQNAIEIQDGEKEKKEKVAAKKDVEKMAEDRPISVDEAKMIEDLVKRIKAETPIPERIAKLLKPYGCETVADLKESQYKHLRNKIEKALAKQEAQK